MMFKCYYYEWESPIFSKIIHHLLEHNPQEKIRLKKYKDNKLKSISYKVIPKTLSYFLKVSEILTCADTESFLRGSPGPKFWRIFIFFRSKGEGEQYQCSYETYTQQPKRATIGPPARRHLNGASLAVRWWSDIDSFVLFQRFQTIIPEEIYSFVLFHAGGVCPDPQVPTPLDPRMNKRHRTMKQCKGSCRRRVLFRNCTVCHLTHRFIITRHLVWHSLFRIFFIVLFYFCHIFI